MVELVQPSVSNQTILHQHLDFEGILGASSEARLAFPPFSSRFGDPPGFPQDSFRAGRHEGPQESLGPGELWAAWGTHSSLLLLANSKGITWTVLQVENVAATFPN